MKDEERLICNRLLDMANNCYYRNIPVTSDFLDLNSQTLFHGIISELPDVKWIMTGGYELAERRMIIFLPAYIAYITVTDITKHYRALLLIKCYINFK
mgnify:CR=1 FL=1